MGQHGFFGSGYNLPRGEEKTGRFGRMFPKLPPLETTEEKLDKLGAAMVDVGLPVLDETGNPKIGRDGKPIHKDDPKGDNPTIPAGYTYFGQFVDHDITLDITSLTDKQNDPREIENFRTPGLDLDSLYGAGPSVQPYLYDPTSEPRGKFLIGETTQSGTRRPGEVIGVKPNDLPRAFSKVALIGDPRNDENLIVAQMHLAFLKFHNKLVDKLGSFEEARKTVVWHYQWIVLNDFLRRILDTKQLDEVLNKGRHFYRFRQYPFIPVEFSVAAYRLGHSMVRAVYDYNRVFTLHNISTDSKLTEATLELLFAFTQKSDSDPNGGPGLNPTLPSNWIIDWRRFFELEGVKKEDVGLSRKLDPYLAEPLTNLPNVPPPSSLAIRNLRRGLKLGLPSGQRVAKSMGLCPLSPKDIATSGSDGAVAKELGFDVETPLWYYILKEAQIKGKGERLGEVGSRIVAEVFVGLLEADKTSFLVSNPNWQPTLGKVPGRFTLADLLDFVGDQNPIGN
ncbi:hypothetical protein K9N68_15085 [Kovacikia minuta CCNUW1]|uniref:peroxidase family protein n=1 Tax=Kovacikia minuta TaxID=2931930 RepID=UPI001CCFD36D|nr:heme peroxidase family protein [Kovacikia minuta]UBF29041.1 hypothetical protein K9N68_15085 [Kovacikia minuta CCNUW1]